ncbi:MAG: glycerate kinase [Paracoccus sp. (in: a-proteobacteria)]
MGGTLRHRARALFSVAVAAAEPAGALRAALARHPLPAPGRGGSHILIAIGKAAIPMAGEMLAHLGNAPAKALVVTNRENLRNLDGATVMQAGHPIPDDDGLRAARAVIALLRDARAGDRVIALISGGGSAMLPAPAGGLSLADKAEANRIFLERGLDIREINLIRQQLSTLKGGGFLRLADPAPVSAYILSDVVGDDLAVVASGPTVAPIGTAAEARSLIEAKGLWPLMPEAIRVHLSGGAPHPVNGIAAQNHLIGSNRQSLDAAAGVDGEAKAEIVDDRLTGDVSTAAAQIVAAAGRARAASPACLIFGGETTVQIRGSGTGGRNQELALRVALAMPDLRRDWVFLSGGTDGRDGPTDAAGGMVDAGTALRIRAGGRDPAAMLAENDSHAALKLAGDLLITGGTGTNVADVQILLLGPRSEGPANPHMFPNQSQSREA